MARCGCSSECLCTVRGNPGVRVTGSGSQLTPYTVSLVLDPDTDNILTVSEAGLLALFTDLAILAEDTACIEFTGDGSPADPLLASPRLSEEPGNGLSCGLDGLMATSVGVPLYTPREIDTDDDVLFGELCLVNTAGATVNLILPPAGEVSGGVVVIKKLEAANTVNVTGYGAQEIDGATGIALTSQWASATLVSSGFAWYRIGSM